MAPLVIASIFGLGGIGWWLFKPSHSASVHVASLGNKPIVVGNTSGDLKTLPGLPVPPILTTTKPGESTLSTEALTLQTVKLAPPVVIGMTPAGNTLHVISPINPETGKSTQIFDVATQGVAAKPAHDLYDYLVANGPKTNGTTAFQDLVKAFQTAHDSDPKAIQLSGSRKLMDNGVYDQITSGVLTLYTGHPILPALNVPPPVPATTAQINDTKRTEPVQSPVAYSSHNLDAYLKLHGVQKTDPVFKGLVKAFQHDVNTDPTYPGPVSYSGVKFIKDKLVEDGAYGPMTYKALAVITLDTVKP